MAKSSFLSPLRSPIAMFDGSATAAITWPARKWLGSADAVDPGAGAAEGPQPMIVRVANSQMRLMVGETSSVRLRRTLGPDSLESAEPLPGLLDRREISDLDPVFSSLRHVVDVLHRLDTSRHHYRCYAQAGREATVQPDLCDPA